MRTLLLGLGLIFVGCNDNNDNGTKDLSVVVNHDLAVNNDLNGVSTCDPVKQDCGAGMKCTYTQPDPMATSLSAVCVPQTGTKGFEESCTRNNMEAPGDDDCKAGFFCSVIGWGGVPGMNDHCNQMCRTTADCPANHHCISRSDFSGDCVRDCGKLDSTSCGGGLVCSELLNDIDSTQQTPDLFLTCRAAGTAMNGDACTDDTDCAANLLCDTQDGVCVDGLCDDGRSCPAGDGGLACQTLNNTGFLGICQ